VHFFHCESGLAWTRTDCKNLRSSGPTQFNPGPPRIALWLAQCIPGTFRPGALDLSNWAVRARHDSAIPHPGDGIPAFSYTYAKAAPPRWGDSVLDPRLIRTEGDHDSRPATVDHHGLTGPQGGKEQKTQHHRILFFFPDSMMLMFFVFSLPHAGQSTPL